MLKLIKPRCTNVKAFVLLAILLLSEQTSANAGQQFHSLASGQAQSLSHDLVQPNHGFFRQGQCRLEREIQILERRQTSSTQPILKINSVPRLEKNAHPAVVSTYRANNNIHC